MTATLEHAYRYSGASAVDGDALRLFTSGGEEEHPRFFEGWLPDAHVHATALLLVARVARTSFFDQSAARLLDPVVTCHVDRLRFEAFSSCCGVYVRYDIGAAALDGEVLRPGATNIDVNQPLRTALSRIGARSPLHLGVGPEDVTVMTDDGAVTERKVDLPVRWVKGFGEVGVAQAALEPRLELSGTVAQRLLRSAPKGDLQLVRGPRWSTVATPGAVAVGGAERLRALDPLARFARRLVVYGGDRGVSAFVLDTGGSSLHLVLSPQTWRGFSGEGGVLGTLASERLGEIADAVEEDLAWQSTLDVRSLAVGRDRGQVSTALELVAGRGRAGFDLTQGTFFHRELPYDLERVEGLHPRLAGARRLLESRGVRLVAPGEAWVRGTHGEHRVRLDDDPPACTCTWWIRHRGSRGPCRHVLAAQMLRDE